MRKRYYLLFVSRDQDGELLKVPIPLHYVYTFLIGAVIGMMTITGMAGSYARMLAKTMRFNQLRTEKEALKKNYTQMEQVAEDKQQQVASMSMLASEVSSLYGLKSDPVRQLSDSSDEHVLESMNELHRLKNTAMSGTATIALSLGPVRNMSTNDWARMAEAPSLWPVEGTLTSSFGERLDPFSGEGAFHKGVDISAIIGTPILAPADGLVETAQDENGYGRCVTLDHGHGVTTIFGHMSAFAVTPGERVHRGEIIGYVGSSGRSTGAHVHYEVRIDGTPVNPHSYLKQTYRGTAPETAYGQ
ncbi:MAG: peptidoglycan DD-metalloendopeptidase family protein [Acidobacteriaceae bacterium]